MGRTGHPWVTKIIWPTVSSVVQRCHVNWRTDGRTDRQTDRERYWRGSW